MNKCLGTLKLQHKLFNVRRKLFHFVLNEVFEFCSYPGYSFINVALYICHLFLLTCSFRQKRNFQSLENKDAEDIEDNTSWMQFKDRKRESSDCSWKDRWPKAWHDRPSFNLALKELETLCQCTYHCVCLTTKKLYNKHKKRSNRKDKSSARKLMLMDGWRNSSKEDVQMQTAHIYYTTLQQIILYI